MKLLGSFFSYSPRKNEPNNTPAPISDEFLELFRHGTPFTADSVDALGTALVNHFGVTDGGIDAVVQFCKKEYLDGYNVAVAMSNEADQVSVETYFVVMALLILRSKARPVCAEVTRDRLFNDDGSCDLTTNVIPNGYFLMQEELTPLAIAAYQGLNIERFASFNESFLKAIYPQQYKSAFPIGTRKAPIFLSHPLAEEIPAANLVLEAINISQEKTMACFEPVRPSVSFEANAQPPAQTQNSLRSAPSVDSSSDEETEVYNSRSGTDPDEDLGYQNIDSMIPGAYTTANSWFKDSLEFANILADFGNSFHPQIDVAATVKLMHTYLKKNSNGNPSRKACEISAGIQNACATSEAEFASHFTSIPGAFSQRFSEVVNDVKKDMTKNLWARTLSAPFKTVTSATQSECGQRCTTLPMLICSAFQQPKMTVCFAGALEATHGKSQSAVDASFLAVTMAICSAIAAQSNRSTGKYAVYACTRPTQRNLSTPVGVVVVKENIPPIRSFQRRATNFRGY